jgi:hypothetical protein
MKAKELNRNPQHWDSFNAKTQSGEGAKEVKQPLQSLSLRLCFFASLR